MNFSLSLSLCFCVFQFDFCFSLSNFPSSLFVNFLIAFMNMIFVTTFVDRDCVDMGGEFEKQEGLRHHFSGLLEI